MAVIVPPRESSHSPSPRGISVLDGAAARNGQRGFPQDQSDLQLASLIRQLYQRARAARDPLTRSWLRNWNVLNNRTWGVRAGWQPNTEIPEVWPIVASMVGWQTDQRPDFDVQPSAIPFTPAAGFYGQLADDLGTVLKSAWMNHDYDAEVEKVLWDASTYGIGWVKSVWNNSLDSGLGNAQALRVDPFTLYPDPSATSPLNWNYVIEARLMSLQELDRRIPGAFEALSLSSPLGDAESAPNRAGTLPMSNPWANPSRIAGAPGQPTPSEPSTPSRNQPAGSQMLNHSGIMVYEAWLRQHAHTKSGTEDTWRCVIMANNMILFDKPATEMWGHGDQPYERFVPVDTGEMYGPSLVEQLAPLQIAINRITAAIEQNIWLSGNPVFLDNTRAGLGRTQITNKPGARVTMQDGGTASWLNPPQMAPQMASTMIQFLKGEMENISGLSAVTRGFTPTGRNSQGVMSSVQEAGFVRVRMSLRQMERTLRHTGNKIASLISEFYDAPRVVAISGDENRTSLALTSLHFYAPDSEGDKVPLRFQLVVDAGSQLPTSRDALTNMALQLFGLHAIDNEALLEMVKFPGAQRIVARMRLAASSNPNNPEAAMLGAPAPGLPPTTAAAA